MIIGFNTNIVYRGVTYHVQTEDKGLKTPLILSLVYDRGTILASKRSFYDDLLDGDFNEKELAERLQRQHKLICAAIRAGRIEDLKRMTIKESAAKQAGFVVHKETRPILPRDAESKSVIVKKTAHTLPPVFANDLKKSKPPIGKINDAIAVRETVLEIPLSIIADVPLFDKVQIIEEKTILPAEPVVIIDDSAKSQPSDGNLKIELLDDPVFKSGERKTLTVTVRRGNAEHGLDAAHVMIKIIGSSFRPLIFHAKTDRRGTAIVPLRLPQFRAGRAAIIIRAISGGAEVELRRAIQHEFARA